MPRKRHRPANRGNHRPSHHDDGSHNKTVTPISEQAMNQQQYLNLVLDNTAAAIEQRPRPAKILYSECTACQSTDAPGEVICMDCWTRGIPYSMKQVRA